MRVLLVEDYGPIARSIKKGLVEAGFAVDVSADGDEGLWYAREHCYDCVILDIMLPGMDGLSILRTLREKGERIPVLLLTAKDTVADRVCGLDAGADDYLVKPFAFEELLARVRALVRRRYDVAQSTVQVADLEVDTSRRTVRRAGREIALSAREYALLEFLALRHGSVVSRSELWEHVYDFAAEPSSNVIDVYVSYLRKKIDQGHEQKLLQTRRGLGYVLSAGDE